MNRSCIFMLLLILPPGCSEQTSPAQGQANDAGSVVEAPIVESTTAESTTAESTADVFTGLVAPDAEVIVLAGLDQTIEWLESEDWWGENKHEVQLVAPRAVMTSISKNWQEISQSIPVQTKKEIFYRFLLPLIMHANAIVLDRRARLEGMQRQLLTGATLQATDSEWLIETGVLLRIVDTPPATGAAQDVPALQALIDEVLYRLDIIPAGLALGQAAYESGYGTSRFAAQGNALFGQWAFDNTGMTPLEQREELGDYRIAAFEWPFDSVRSYYINLSRHPAYEEFRRLRAEMRAAGQKLDSLALAEGLTRYSERGQEYVETLQGIIRVNNLAIADDAVFRDEPMRFLITAEDEAEASRLRIELDEMREAGLLAELIERMNLN